jgi:hypothetical protein
LVFQTILRVTIYLKTLRILGTRGVPIAHGGFETFGEERLHIPVTQEGSKGTIAFDWQATAHAARHKDFCLTMGYNTVVFCALLRSRLSQVGPVRVKKFSWHVSAKLVHERNLAYLKRQQ